MFDLPISKIGHIGIPVCAYGNASASRVLIPINGILRAKDKPLAALIPTLRELNPPGPNANAIANISCPLILHLSRASLIAVSYTHLTLPTSDLV